MLLHLSQRSFQINSIGRQRRGLEVIPAHTPIRNQDVKEIHLQKINRSFTCNRKPKKLCNLSDNPINDP